MGLKNSSTAKRVLASLSVLGALGAIAGLATYANFTSSTSGSESISSGTVTVALGGAGLVNDLAVPATDIAAGDTIDRLVDVKNNGTLDWASLTITPTASTSSVLDSNASGLTYEVKNCPTAWTGTAPNYVCGAGGTTPVSVGALSAAITAGATTLTGGLSLTAGGVDHLLVRMALPGAATAATFAGKSSVILFTFNATQRAATAK